MRCWTGRSNTATSSKEKNDAIELEQRLKRRAELQALQAQINRYFCITRWTPSGGSRGRRSGGHQPDGA